MTVPKVLLCRCAIHKCLPPDEVSAVERQLADVDAIELIVVDDLCAATMSDRADLRVDQAIGCHPRALRWILARDEHGSALPDDALHDLRTHSADEILSRFQTPGDAPKSPMERRPDSADVDGRGWFPVLDYDRCTHCAQCLSFCLFDVFGSTDDGKITVERPENCKDNCPACARICPEIAIIFPKATDSPINGDDIEDELMEREKARIALEQTGAANFRTALKNRRQGGLLKPEARERIDRKNEDSDPRP